MKISSSNPTFLDESAITAVIDRFYERVRADPTLGPVLNVVVVDWDEHLRKLAALWSSVMLTSGHYKGNPMAVHRRQADVSSPRCLIVGSRCGLRSLPSYCRTKLRARCKTRPL